jgi:ABC-type multidrug transport system permease subunit
MDLKLERLSNGERIAAGSALALFVCMFFGWFNFGFDTASAWEALHYISPTLASPS